MMLAVDCIIPRAVDTLVTSTSYVLQLTSMLDDQQRQGPGPDDAFYVMRTAALPSRAMTLVAT